MTTPFRTKTLSCSCNLSPDGEVVTFGTEWDDHRSIRFETGQTLQRRSSYDKHDNADEFPITIDVRRSPNGEKSNGTMRIDEEGPGRGYIDIQYEAAGGLFGSLVQMLRTGNIPQYVTINLNSAPDAHLFPLKNTDRIPLSQNISQSQLGYEWHNKTVSNHQEVVSLQFSYALLEAREFQLTHSIYSPRARRGGPIMSASERIRLYREQTQDIREINVWIKRFALLVGAITLIAIIRSTFDLLSRS